MHVVCIFQAVSRRNQVCNRRLTHQVSPVDQKSPVEIGVAARWARVDIGNLEPIRAVLVNVPGVTLSGPTGGLQRQLV